AALVFARCTVARSRTPPRVTLAAPSLRDSAGPMIEAADTVGIVEARPELRLRRQSVRRKWCGPVKVYAIDGDLAGDLHVGHDVQGALTVESEAQAQRGPQRDGRVDPHAIDR